MLLKPLPTLCKRTKEKQMCSSVLSTKQRYGIHGHTQPPESHSSLHSHFIATHILEILQGLFLEETVHLLFHEHLKRSN